MIRTRHALLLLVCASLACQTLLPIAEHPSGTPTAAPTTAPTATPRPTSTPEPTARPTDSPPPTLQPWMGAVRACGYQPGVSVPAQMPAEVLAGAAPTPYPPPTPPTPSAVGAEITARQLRVYRSLWDTANENYIYADFNGHDWKAIGQKYRALVKAGLTDDDFYRVMNDMIAELGDEHSFYESPGEVQETDASYAGNNDYVGIGVLISAVPQARRGVIIFAFPGSPAAEAGLGAHDSILAVNGEPLLDETGGLRDIVRGPEGTSVTLTVQHPGGEPFDAALIRRRITGAAPIDYCLVPGARLGYLFLPGLDDGTIPEQMRDALAAFAEAGPLDGLVLDNRQNGGGASDILEQVLGLFTSGTVGHFVSRAETRPLEIMGGDVGGSQSVPLVVLVDVDTASFGEVLSGVLQASGRARVVGQTTLGNVEILWGYDFEDGSRAWIAHDTFQPVGLPNGVWEDTGIVPDVFVPTRWDLFTEATDPALAKAVELLSAP